MITGAPLAAEAVAPPAPAPQLRSDRGFWAAFAACAAISVGALFSVRYLPMVDLAQHVAQVTIWTHLDQPAWGFTDRLELHFGTPYLGAYALARLLAVALDVEVAFRVVIALAIVGIPLALLRLLTVTGGDRWWALLGFPLAFGFPFYWGFVNQLVALPLGLWFLAEAHRHVEAPSARRGAGVALLALVLYLAHVFVMAFCVGAAGLVALARAQGWRALLARAWPLAAPLPLLLAWMAWARAESAYAREAPRFRLAWSRLTALPATLTGSPPSDPANALPGVAAIVFVAIVVALALAGGVRARRSWALWLPPAAALLAYLLGPYAFFSSLQFYERFAFFAGALALPALAAPATRRWRAARVGLVAAVLGWLVFVGVQLHRFDRESEGLDEVLAGLEPRRSLAGLTSAFHSHVIPIIPVHLHAPAWYQVRKGGIVSGSFAGLFNMVARYRAGAAPPDPRFGEPDPRRFDWQAGRRYDYFLVRAPEDFGEFLFQSAPEPIVLEAHAGQWWVYRWARLEPLRSE